LRYHSFTWLCRPGYVVLELPSWFFRCTSASVACGVAYTLPVRDVSTRFRLQLPPSPTPTPPPQDTTQQADATASRPLDFEGTAKPGTTGAAAIAVNSPSYRQLHPEAIPAHEAFFYKYFTENPVAEPRVGKKGARADDIADEEVAFPRMLHHTTSRRGHGARRTEAL